MFKPVPQEIDFPKMEDRLLQWWEDNGYRHAYLKKNDHSGKRFSFLDGPITANNPMGVHHAWGRTYKDLFQRFKTMEGFEQRYQNGFDCQGLWVEVEVEKQLGLNSKQDIEAYGIAEFVKRCKERVYKYSAIQTEQSKRLGYWMDWENSYFTMSEENNYTIWHFLNIMHQNGRIYRGHDVMPWCGRCGTGLSEHEIVTEGYKELTHTSLYVKLPLLVDSEAWRDTHLLIWTTTPWTLPANVAVAVHPDETYAQVEIDGEYFLLAEASAKRIFGEDVTVIKRMDGRTLSGMNYKAPLPELPVQQSVRGQVILWDEVDPEEGTGCVHIAPGCGREDFHLGKEYNLDTLAPLDEHGVFVEGYDVLTGLEVKDANPIIIDHLDTTKRLLRTEETTHRYPVCWRCNEELVFRLVDEWFIGMDDWREDIMDVTRKIRWIPEFGMERELDWLRNMSDWMISKKRYWGLALPIWVCQSCHHFDVIAGKEELRERAVSGWDEFEGHSPHRPHIDAVELDCPECQGTMERIPDVGNPWLDAGIVAYSTLHYLTDRDYWEKWFPADLITESFPGQFRNWFYSLLAMSAGITKRPPVRNILGHGLVFDEHGEEMHKSAGNAIWFEDATAEMGADVMRWLYMTHNPNSNVLFGYGKADDARRRFIIPYWNVYSFFVTYARLDEFDPVKAKTTPPESRSLLDQWLLARLHTTLKSVHQSLTNYNTVTATRSLEAFVNDLSNWYVRRSRRRFWSKGKKGNEDDKQAAYETLYEALTNITRALAPFVPFITEHMYQNLVVNIDSAAPPSVHFTEFPKPNDEWENLGLENEMAKIRTIASLGRAARDTAGFKVRQPLAQLMVAGPGWDQRFDHLLRDELNVRQINPVSDDKEFIVYEVKPNYAVLGPKYQKDMPRVARAVEATETQRLIEAIRSNQPITVDGFCLQPEELEVRTHNRPGFAAATEAGYTVAISTELTPELVREGLARDVIRFVQESRKQAGFDVSDHIRMGYEAEGDLPAAIEEHTKTIADEVLADELTPDLFEGHHFETTIREQKLAISLERITDTKKR